MGPPKKNFKYKKEKITAHGSTIFQQSKSSKYYCRYIILFIWAQHAGGNVDKEQWLRFPPKPDDAKAK